MNAPEIWAFQSTIKNQETTRARSDLPPLPAAPTRCRDTGGDAMRIGSCYWRFKGEKEYRYGYATHAERGLWRMGLWNGDTDHGPFVDPYDIEVR